MSRVGREGASTSPTIVARLSWSHWPPLKPTYRPPSIHEPIGHPAGVENFEWARHLSLPLAGKIDWKTLNSGEWAIMSALNASEGDFRDWDEIRDRALTIAGQREALQARCGRRR